MKKSENNKKIDLEEYTELIKTVARVEAARLTTPILEFSEIINIGTTAVYITLSSKPKNYHNASYISTAIKWAIRNELRRRYRWYSLKYSSKKDEENDLAHTNKEELREAVYETILSIDELQQAENPVQIEDNSLNPEQKVELFELKKHINEAMQYLTEKEKSVLEAKFYQNKKIKEITVDYGISASRVSKIIHCALDKIRARLTKKGII